MSKNKNKDFNVLSLFNGMGCVWLALEEAGIKVNKRYSSEIEKFPNKANDTLYDNTIQLGDVRKVDVSKLADRFAYLYGKDLLTWISDKLDTDKQKTVWLNTVTELNKLPSGFIK